jgi:(R,R)-butanediol dehydrogenase/meso-butanediol dehydrogenase/diacetyl reductase
MRAAVWHGRQDVRVDDVPPPAVTSSGDAVVEVDLATICASDVAEWWSGPHVIPLERPHPLTGHSGAVTLGHEYIGHVIDPGDTSFRAGDRVCGDACLRCGRCYWCLRGEYNICPLGGSVGYHLDGAFARQMKVPAYTLFVVPDTVPDAWGALVEPLAVGLHALQRTRFEPGDSVVVMGFGMIGAGCALLAMALGARAVFAVERSESRRRLACDLGLAAAWDPGEPDLRRWVRAGTDRAGADVVLECTGRPGLLEQAVELSRRGGRIGVCGLAHEPGEFRTDRLVYFEREVVGALGYRFDHPTVIDLLAAKRIDLSPLLGAPVSLDHMVESGFERMINDPLVPLRIPVIPG